MRYGQFTDSGNSAQSYGLPTKRRMIKVRLAVAQVILVIVLLFDKRPPSVTPTDLTSLRPCRLRQEGWFATAGADEALYGSGVPQSGPAEYGSGVVVRRNADATFEGRLIKARGIRQARRRRAWRSPRGASRRTMRHPGRRPAKPKLRALADATAYSDLGKRWVRPGRRSDYIPLSGAASGRPLMINLVSPRGHCQILLTTFPQPKPNVPAAHVSFSYDTRT
jgi:hypothetical protein